MTPNRYAALDTGFAPEPFRIPGIQPGDYHIPAGHDKNRDLHFGHSEFAVRRMPRRANHTGKFGLFYDDEDAGEVLIAVLTPENTWECVSKDFETQLYLFTHMESRVMHQKRCAWCGRKLGDNEDMIHQKCCVKAGVVG